MTDYNDGAGNVATIEDFEVTVAFEDGTVSGNAGCNGFSGSFTERQQHRRRRADPTEMACEPAAVMELEAAVSEALAASTALRQEPDGSVALLDAAAPSNSPSSARPTPRGQGACRRSFRSSRQACDRARRRICSSA